MTVFHYPGGLRVGLRKEAVAAPLTSGRVLRESKCMLMVLMSGQQRFLLDDTAYLLSTYLADDPGPKAVFLQLKSGQRLQYTESVGTPLVKVSVSMDEDWMAQAGSLLEEPSAVGLHIEEVADLPWGMTNRVWRISADTEQIAHDLLETHEDFNAGLQSRNAMTLGLMARGVDLLRGAMRDLGALRDMAPADANSVKDPRLERLTHYIAAHLDAPDLSPETLASGCGLSLRSLQRLCRLHFNCSASGFLRQQRLEAAFTALSLGRVNVQQAAFIGGYSNPANFATAFKRLFGMSPKQVKVQRSESYKSKDVL